MSDNDDVRQIDERKEGDGDKPVKTEEEICMG